MISNKFIRVLILIVVLSVMFTAIDFAYISYKGEVELVNATYQEMIMIDKMKAIIIGFKILVSGLLTFLIIKK
ncbi:MAG: hypothetical protein RR744_00365 [Cellulosilyticaceae bacterium]